MRRSPGRAGSPVRLAAYALLVVVAVGVMLRLSLWQWDRAQQRHSVLNYFYAVEWVLFAVLTVAGVARLAVEGRRAVADRQQQEVEPEPERGPAGVLVGPPLLPGQELEEVTWVRLRRRLRLDRSA
jgi:DNA-binding transcriptional regulator of glucitol operon